MRYNSDTNEVAAYWVTIPPPGNLGQRLTFQSGTYHKVFSNAFSLSTYPTLTWHLGGIQPEGQKGATGPAAPAGAPGLSAAIPTVTVTAMALCAERRQ